MDIIEPVTLGDVACARASPAVYYDRAGVLQTAPANTLRVTYDPNDLTKAPYALVERAVLNILPWSEDFSQWPQLYNSVAQASTTLSPDGVTYAQAIVFTVPTSDLGNVYTSIPYVVNDGDTFTGSVFVKGAKGTKLFMMVNSIVNNDFVLTGDWQRLSVSRTQSGLPVTGVSIQIGTRTAGATTVYMWGAQLEFGPAATSYIRTTGSAAWRQADVLSAGAGLVYSNVPIAEPAYTSTTTYAKDTLVYDPVTHNVFQSLIASNLGKVLTDTSAWTPRGATNRWAMLDQYNNTQTSNPEEIVIVVAPQMISQGFYMGNTDAAEVRISVVDQVLGLVYQEVQNQRVPSSGGSAFNWCFKRIRRKTWAVSLNLPPYANPLVTIAIKKPGGVPKCGMCVVGPTMDLGRTLATLGAEIKDFSDTSFNFDGTSKTTIRGWAKRITADVVVDADQVDAVYERMADYRQRPIVWVGSPNYGLAIAFGRYSSLKPVVKGKTRWDMSMQIEGTV